MSFSPSVWGGSVMMLKRPLMGMARSHPRRHRSHRGGLSFGDVWGHVKEGVKDVVPRLLPIARDVGLKLLRSKLGVGRRRRHHKGGIVMTPSRLGSLVRSSMGMARRRRRSRLGGYAASPYVGFSGGRRRSHMGCARTPSFFGGLRHKSRRGSAKMIMGALRSHLRSSIGMRRRRTRSVGMRRHRRRVGMRRHRRVGRGPIGGILGGVAGKLLGNLLPF